MDIFSHHKLGFCPSIIDARVEKLERVFDSLKTMGFTPQNHHVGMLEALCDCQIRQNTKEGAKTIVKVCQWCKRLSSGPLTGHDVLQTACGKRILFVPSEEEEVAQLGIWKFYV